MSKILGLDLGTNSIGWALVDEAEKQIIKTGVRIFPEGVNRDTRGKEISKNATRRSKRQTRRILYRRRYRKWKLIDELVKNQMFPKVSDVKQELKKVNLTDDLRNYFSINAYEARSKAFKGEKLSLYELGRALYHISQRRGYKESIKDNNEDSGTIYEGDIETNKAGINETHELIKQFGSLGHALYQTNPNEKRWRNRYTTRQMYIDEIERIWESQKKFYPKILNDELKSKICDSKTGLIFFQRPLMPQSYLIGNCIFEKNKKRCSKSTIVFELARMYQFINTILIDGEPLTQEQKLKIEELFLTKEKFEFSAITKKLGINEKRFNYENNSMIVGTISISNLRKIITPSIWDNLKPEQQEEFVNIKKFAENKEKTVLHLKTKFGFSDEQAGKFIRFKPSKDYSNLSYKATLNILPFLKQGYLYNESVWLGGIVNAFGKINWDKFESSQQDYIINTALDIYFNKAYDSKETLREWLGSEFKLTEKQLNRLYHHSDFTEINDELLTELPEPENLRNPVVQQTLFELRKLINEIIRTYGSLKQIRIELSRELKSTIRERSEMRYRQMQNERQNDEIKKRLSESELPHTMSYLQKMRLFMEIEQRAGLVACPYTGKSISAKQLWNGEVEIEHIVPYSKSLDDSLANKTLCFREINQAKGNRTPFEYYTKEFGNDSWEDAKKRAFSLLPYPKWKKFIDERPKTLEEFEQRKLNDNRYISRKAVEYLRNICKDVRSTQGQITALLRHIWGLDNILNAPIRLPGLENGEYFVAVDANRNVLFTEPWTDNEKQQKNIYAKMAKQGYVLQGNVKDGTFNSYKTRFDHRHHAVDAIAIAFTKESFIQTLSKMRGAGADEMVLKNKIEEFQIPENFFNNAKKAIENTIISYKKNVRLITKVSKFKKTNGKKRKVEGIAIRGPLHEESIYGRRKDLFNNYAYHIRKPLSTITTRAQVDKVADPAVKKLIEQSIIKTWQEKFPEDFTRNLSTEIVLASGDSFIINPNTTKKYDVPKGAFFEEIKDETGKKIIGRKPKIFLPNKNGTPVPVKKVRLRNNSVGSVILKEGINQWVEPGSNFGVVLYEKENGEFAENVVSFWSAVERKKQGLPPLSMPNDGKRIISTMQINDTFLLGIGENPDWNNPALLNQHLYRVQKLSTTDYFFRRIVAATLDFEKDIIRIRSFKGWKETNPIKVKINPLGDISPIVINN